MVCDAHGYPLNFTLSPGQHADSAYFAETLDQVRLPGRRGRPIKRCREIIADTGYDSHATPYLSNHCATEHAPETEAGATKGV